MCNLYSSFFSFHKKGEEVGVDKMKNSSMRNPHNLWRKIQNENGLMAAFLIYVEKNSPKLCLWIHQKKKFWNDHVPTATLHNNFSPRHQKSFRSFLIFFWCLDFENMMEKFVKFNQVYLFALWFSSWIKLLRVHDKKSR